jgi:hypothetical protein
MPAGQLPTLKSPTTLTMRESGPAPVWVHHSGPSEVSTSTENRCPARTVTAMISALPVVVFGMNGIERCPITTPCWLTVAPELLQAAANTLIAAAVSSTAIRGTYRTNPADRATVTPSGAIATTSNRVETPDSSIGLPAAPYWFPASLAGPSGAALTRRSRPQSSPAQTPPPRTDE